MVDFKLFKDTLDEIKAAQDFRREVRQAINNLDKKNIKNLNIDFMGEDTIMIAHESRVINLLALLFTNNEDDEIANAIEETLEWYIYDTEWGTSHAIVCYSDGTIVEINTLEKLYEDIMRTFKILNKT